MTPRSTAAWSLSLEKLITDNAINFSDDKASRDWTVGYYLDNAKLRLHRASALWDHETDQQTLPTVERFLRIRGSMVVGLIRYEWEAAHYALRLLFKAYYGKAAPEPKKPTLPQPEGLEAMFAPFEQFDHLKEES